MPGMYQNYSEHTVYFRCIFEAAFQERIKLVYFMSDVYLVQIMGICGAEF